MDMTQMAAQSKQAGMKAGMPGGRLGLQDPFILMQPALGITSESAGGAAGGACTAGASG